MIKSIKLENALGLLKILESRLHSLRNTWPCGIQSVDDQTDEQIKKIVKDIEDLKPKIKLLREEQKLINEQN